MDVLTTVYKILCNDSSVGFIERARTRVLFIIVLTVICVLASVLITYLILWSTNSPMLPIIFCIATIAPGVITPIATWAISGLIIKTLKLEDEYKKLATYDDLTGVLSRRAFFSQGIACLQLCQRNNVPCAVAVLDLDKFKAVNDKFGHGGGDAVLRAFAHIVKAAIRASDRVGRIGGEEFAIVFPESTISEAKFILQRIKNNLEQHNIEYQGNTLKVTVSAGLSAMELGSVNDNAFSALIKRADEALYSAKASGRNTIVLTSL